MSTTAKKMPASVDHFDGFPPAGLQFLRNLKRNNDRDWFRERKALYQKNVEHPMAMLVTEAAGLCRKRGLMIAANDKNPVMRVYRDIRFSPDKRPFKTHVGASLRRLDGKTAHGEIYLHISPEESFFAAGFWMPERPFLRAWREAMVAQPAAFLRMVKSLRKRDLNLSEEGRLTRLPRGYDNYAQNEVADFLRLTSYVTVQPLAAKDHSSAKLVDSVVDFCLAAKPLLEYGWGLNYSPQRDILEER